MAATRPFFNNHNHAIAGAATLRATPRSEGGSLHNAVCGNVVNRLCDAAHWPRLQRMLC
jgi:hypothetical protein